MNRNQRWCYDVPEEGDERDRIAIRSEQEILEDYWDNWQERMIKKYGKDHYLINEQNCIDDWIITNYAYKY